jgi:hypothetical protein
MKEGKVLIEIKEWDYTCGDGCCTDYGHRISVNGVECENEYSGGNVEQAIEFVLNQLNVKFEIKEI